MIKVKKIIFWSVVLFVIVSVSLVFAQESGEGGGIAPVPSNGSSGGGGGVAPTPANGSGGGGGGAIEKNTTISFYPSYSGILGGFNNQTWLPVIVRLKNNSDIDNFLNLLAENDFDGEGTSTGFVGFITKNGFETLLNDSRVKSVSWTKYGAQASLDNKSKAENISEIEKEPEFETLTDVSTTEEINESKEKPSILPWIIVVVILLIVVFYLIAKSKKK